MLNFQKTFVALFNQSAIIELGGEDMAVKEGRCRFMIQLDNEKKELLQKMAEDEGRSLSNFINRIIDLYLAEKK